MNSNADTTPRPASILRIAGDPTAWGMGSVWPRNPGWTGPVALPIVVPVEGTLVLSPARVGGLTLADPAWQNGWVPAAVPVPILYIPTAVGLKENGGYPLARPDNDTEALTERILTAMRTGSTITVALDIFGGGVAVLDGAVLPFAAVAPAR
jgi:hypothetical protein